MKEVNDANFEQLVLNSEKPAVVDLWAPWCGPCRMVSPILEELSEERTDVDFFKCNIDENPNVAKRYNVRSIPTIMYFNKGKLLDTQVGATSKAFFAGKLNKLYS